MLLLFLLASVQALTCPEYTCKNSNLTFVTQQCIFYADHTYYLDTCKNSQVPYCQPTSSDKNITCIPTPPQKTTGVAWPGEKCQTDSNCAYGACDQGYCNSKTYNQTCSLDDECNPGLFCNLGKCDFQRLQGANCTREEECANSCTCALDSSSGMGKCSRYYYLDPGTPIDVCNNYKSLACKSGLCGPGKNGFVCSEPVRSKYPTPSKCLSDSKCVSEKDSQSNTVFNSTCTCGYNNNGTSYCNLFPGDTEYDRYLSNLGAWYSSQEINNCNTVRRKNFNCIKDHLDYQGYLKLWYYYNQVAYYPAIQENDFCTKKIYNQQYWQAYEEYHGNSGNNTTDNAAMLSTGLVLLLLS